MKLFYSPGACSLAAHITLEEIGKPFELQLVSTADGSTQKPNYLAINPKGRVPALDLGGRILTELPAILFYLAQTNPESHFLPPDYEGQARALEWMNWLSGTVHGVGIAGIWRPNRFSDDVEIYPALNKKGMANTLENFKQINHYLEGKSWAVSNQYSIVDPFLLVLYRWGLRLKIDMATYPAFANVAKAVFTRPATQRAFKTEEIILG